VPALSKPKPTTQIRRSDTPLAHLIQAADRQMDDSGLMKFPWTHGPAVVDLFHGIFNRNIIY
jgi:hypothetical protein